MKKATSETFKLTDEEFEQLAKEGADPRLNKRQAAFDALLAHCLGAVVPRSKPLTDESVKVLQSLDKFGCEIAKKSGVEVRDED